MVVFLAGCDGWTDEEREGVRASMQHSRQPDSLRRSAPPDRPPRRAIDKTEKSSVIGEILNRRFLAVSGSFKSIAPCSEKTGSSHDTNFP